MPNDLLTTPIAYLKGVGPQRAEVLQSEFQINTLGDLLAHYPYRYIDRTRLNTIRSITPQSNWVQLRGRFSGFRMLGDKRARRLTGKFEDDTGEIELVWFRGIDWIQKSLKPGTEYLVFGKPVYFNGTFNIPHPECEPAGEADQVPGLQPVYHTSEKAKRRHIDSKAILKLQQTLHAQLQPADVPEFLPEDLRRRNGLPDRFEAMRQIHFPGDLGSSRRAIERFKFEELFLLQLRILQVKINRNAHSAGHLFPQIGNLFLGLYEKHLPFALTGAQKRVLKEIRRDTLSGHQMNRLVQGDVGSGKTIVALLSMLMAIDNGFQACMLAPTEILAQQHYLSIAELLRPLSVPVAFLSGQVKGQARKEILAGLANGVIQVLIGTHAVLEEPVRFSKLGMAVIDEQHRFGVEQRAKLWAKSLPPPHVLVMTATPIPRTLAMTLYGDLDVSVIDELPPGRKPVKTVHATEAQRLRVHGLMKEQIALGRQVYVVYPLIEENEALDLTALYQGLEALERSFPRPEYQIGMVHGKLKAAEKDFEMNRFVKGETQILIATTVIEVGVNVPNASVMVIEHADRFGLAQLHQLRGRVGRGADQSFCLLMTGNKLSQDSERRIQVMCRTQDGFEIAEEDLTLRGPGDLDGTRQSGDLPLKLANLIEDKSLMESARNEAQRLLETDPELQHPQHAALKTHFSGLTRSGYWSRIS